MSCGCLCLPQTLPASFRSSVHPSCARSPNRITLRPYPYNSCNNVILTPFIGFRLRRQILSCSRLLSPKKDNFKSYIKFAFNKNLFKFNAKLGVFSQILDPIFNTGSSQLNFMFFYAKIQDGITIMVHKKAIENQTPVYLCLHHDFSNFYPFYGLFAALQHSF